MDEVLITKEMECKFDFFATGTNGLVGRRFHEIVAYQTNVSGPIHEHFDITWPEEKMKKILGEIKRMGRWCLVNFAAVTDVDACEDEKGDKNGLVWQTNVGGPSMLAKICKELELGFVHISTDYVFSGRTYPHKESEKPDPVDSWYAMSKLAGEKEVQKHNPNSHIVRIQLPFTDDLISRKDLPRLVAGRLVRGKEFAGVVDQHVTPCFVDDIVKAVVWIFSSRDYGIWHVASSTIVTPNEFAHMVVQALMSNGLELDGSLIKEATFEEFSRGRRVPRPKDNAFDIPNGKFVKSFGGEILRPLDVMLSDWARRFVRNLKLNGKV